MLAEVLQRSPRLSELRLCGCGALGSEGAALLCAAAARAPALLVLDLGLVGADGAAEPAVRAALSAAQPALLCVSLAGNQGLQHALSALPGRNAEQMLQMHVHSAALDSLSASLTVLDLSGARELGSSAAEHARHLQRVAALCSSLWELRIERVGLGDDLRVEQLVCASAEEGFQGHAGQGRCNRQEEMKALPE